MLGIAAGDGKPERRTSTVPEVAEPSAGACSVAESAASRISIGFVEWQN